MLVFEPCFIVSHASSVRCKSSSQNVLPETLLPPLGGPQSLPATISAEASKSPFWSPGRLILAAPGDRVLNPPSKHRAGRATRVTRMGYELPPFACPGVLRELACHTLPSTPGPAECAKRLNNLNDSNNVNNSDNLNMETVIKFFLII